MKQLLTGLFVLAILNAPAQQAKDTRMKTFIDALMKKMTLDEKLGQLNLPGSGDIPARILVKR
jgi:beta-glucosidase